MLKSIILLQNPRLSSMEGFAPAIGDYAHLSNYINNIGKVFADSLGKIIVFSGKDAESVISALHAQNLLNVRGFETERYEKGLLNAGSWCGEIFATRTIRHLREYFNTCVVISDEFNCEYIAKHFESCAKRPINLHDHKLEPQHGLHLQCDNAAWGQTHVVSCTTLKPDTAKPSLAK